MRIDGEDLLRLARNGDVGESANDFASPGQTPGTLSDSSFKTWDGGGRQPKTDEQTPEDGGVAGPPSSPPYAEGDISGESEPSSHRG